MKRALPLVLSAVVVAAGGLVTHAQPQQADGEAQQADRRGGLRFFASLRPSNEVPAVSSPAQGELHATLDPVNGVLDYELTFDGLQAPVVQAHIHMAQKNVNGGIVLWLCGTVAQPGPAGTPPCPTPGGTVTGQLSAANVVAQTTQGIAAGDFDEVIEAMRNGLAYANVHSTGSPGGEIRGQIQRGRHGRGDDDRN